MGRPGEITKALFNVLGGNIDDHDKNISFLMDRQGKWSLAPAYDMVYSIDPSSLSFQKGQFMTIKGRGIGINKTTCDIMQKELNDKYSSFRSS